MSQIYPFSQILALRRSEHAKPKKKDVAWLRKRNGLAGWKKRSSGELRRSVPVRLRKSACVRPGKRIEFARRRKQY